MKNRVFLFPAGFTRVDFFQAASVGALLWSARVTAQPKPSSISLFEGMIKNICLWEIPQK